jgi:hypothetical protein
MVLTRTDSGENDVFYCDSCDYAANSNRAESTWHPVQTDGGFKEAKEVDTPNIKSIEDLSSFFSIPQSTICKSLIYIVDNKRAVIALIRGDMAVEETKLQNAIGAYDIRIASDEEVKELTADIDKDVLGVAINPCLETIVRIARYPKGTRFGLVCLSREFHFKVENALKSAGLEIDEIVGTTSRQDEDIENIIKSCDVIIVSPGRRDDVKKLATGRLKREIISFDYSLDQGSVKAVISKIMESKKHV